MELGERDKKTAKEYRAILNHYGFIDIASDLSDEAIYDLMSVINWMGGGQYSNYYDEYRNVEKDAEKLSELKDRYIKRTRMLLQESGFDEKQIEDKISKGFAEKVLQLHCWAGGLQCMFRDKFGSEDVLEEYIRELEKGKKGFTTGEIGEATIDAPTEEKYRAGQAESGEKEGEEVRDDN